MMTGHMIYTRSCVYPYNYKIPCILRENTFSPLPFLKVTDKNSALSTIGCCLILYDQHLIFQIVRC